MIWIWIPHGSIWISIPKDLQNEKVNIRIWISKDRIQIFILEDGRQGLDEEKDLNLYSKEFARTTGFKSPLDRFRSLNEEEMETKAIDLNSRNKDSIPLEEFSRKSKRGRSRIQISYTGILIWDLEIWRTHEWFESSQEGFKSHL